MDATSLLHQLRQERSDLEAAIQVLESRLGSRPSATTTVHRPRRKGHVWSAARRKAMSEKLRASWAKRKKKSAKK